MRVYEVLIEDGRIVKGVNTTVDVGVGQIPIEAGKFGNAVDRDGRPPTLSKKVKGKSTNVLYNLGLTESEDNHIPYQDIIAKAIDDKKMTYIDPNTGEERSVMNPKHVGNKQKELEFKYIHAYPMNRQERLAIRPWVNIPGDKNLMRLPVTQMTMQQAVDWDMLGHPDMPQATIDAARKRYPNDERVKNPTTYKLRPENEDIEENFADGKKKGKSRPGRVKRSGASCKGSVTSLRKKAAKYSGEKGKMYHWCANMKSGRSK